MIDTDTSHRAVGLEVDLELAIGGTRREVAHTHHLGVQFVQGHSVKHDALRDELRVRILVAKVLAEIQFLFRVNRILWRHSIDGHASGAVCGNMDKFGVVQQAELDAMRRAAHVDIFNLSALGEVLHHGGAVEHGIHFAIHLDFLGHIAVDDAQTAAKQLVIVVAEVVIQHPFQSTFRLFLVLGSHHAPNDRHILAVDEFLEDMDAQEPRCSSK